MIGLPGNPLSALVVFRLVGVPVVRRVGGTTVAPPEPTVRARLDRQVPSQTGRLDVVQVRVDHVGRTVRWPARCSAPRRCCRC